jgi:hypothetical protein
MSTTNATRAVVVAATLMAVAGCSMADEHPSRAMMDQSESTLRSDEHLCEGRASFTPNDPYAYAACMMARGYQTHVQLGVPYMIATSQRYEPRVRADLEECGTRALARTTWAQQSAAERALSALSIVGPGSPTAFGTGLAVAQSISMDGVFRDCLAPRGYTIDLYQAPVEVPRRP